VVVRFEGDVHRRAAHVFARLTRDAERFRFGVRLALAMVPAFAERAPVANDNGAHRRIRRRVAAPARG
jgi:hypothetical protein